MSSDGIDPQALARLLTETRRAGREGLSLPQVQRCIGQRSRNGQVGKDKARQAATALIEVGLLARRPHHTMGKTYDRYIASAPLCGEDQLIERAWSRYLSRRERQRRRAAEKADS